MSKHYAMLPLLAAALFALAPVALAQESGISGTDPSTGATGRGQAMDTDATPIGSQQSELGQTEHGEHHESIDTTHSQSATAPREHTLLSGDTHDGKNCPCPMCPMKSKGDQETAGMNDAQHQQMKMLMNAELSKNDPAALLAMRDELHLTPDQTRQLEQIQRENRARVENILSQEQRQELAALPESAQSFRSLHDNMAALDTRDRSDQSMTETERSMAERQGESADESGIESIDRPQSESASRSGDTSGSSFQNPSSNSPTYSPGSGLSGRSQE